MQYVLLPLAVSCSRARKRETLLRDAQTIGLLHSIC